MHNNECSLGIQATLSVMDIVLRVVYSYTVYLPFKEDFIPDIYIILYSLLECPVLQIVVSTFLFHVRW